jgi:ATP-dependent Clp protease ATP-binding subunit ClpX
MVSGPGVNICDDCVELCQEIIATEFDRMDTLRRKKLPKPQDIFDHLEQYVVGQTDAKRALAVAVYNHYKRTTPYALHNDTSVEIAKSNILLLGPTGTGKTYLAQTLARIMEVPFAIVDATALTEAGYIGEDVENILVRLVQAADGDVQKAQQGIIYIDEVDKLARRGDSANLTRDVSGEGVQQGLLKILEGTVASIPATSGRKHPGQDFQQIDTSNILFIVSGAFAGLSDIIEERLNKTSVGFGAPLKRAKTISTNILQRVETEDLHKYGMIPEFIGRLPVVTSVKALQLEDLVTILTEPKNSIIKQYKRLFELDGVYLQFEPDAVQEIAQLALERENGARGLRSIVEQILESIMFEIPSRTDIEGVIVTAESVQNPDVEPTIMTRLHSKNAVDKGSNSAHSSRKSSS